VSNIEISHRAITWQGRRLSFFLVCVLLLPRQSVYLSLLIRPLWLLVGYTNNKSLHIQEKQATIFGVLINRDDRVITCTAKATVTNRLTTLPFVQVAKRSCRVTTTMSSHKGLTTGNFSGIFPLSISYPSSRDWHLSAI
jgi:hypothetical protein